MACFGKRATGDSIRMVGWVTASVAMLAIAPSSVSSQPAYTHPSWVQTKGPAGGLGYDIRYNFADSNEWYVTDAWSGVHRSTDRGISWSTSNVGFSIAWGPAGDTIPVFSLTVDPHDPDIVWAGTQNTGQIFRSTDAGLSWTDRSQGIDQSLSPHLSFRGFTVDPAGSDTVYAMGEIGSPAWAPGGATLIGRLTDKTMGIVYKTEDAGLNWTEIWRGDSLARYCWIDPGNPNVVYLSTGIFDREAANTDVPGEVAGGVGILKSTDGGESWGPINNGLTDLYVGSLYMNPEDSQVLLAAASNDQWSNAPPTHTGGVFRTENGGGTWTRVLANELFSVVEYCTSDPDVAYAGSYQAMYRSDDRGANWLRFNRQDGTWGSPGLVAGFPIDVQCDPNDPMRVAVNNYLGGNFLSRNGGRTWLSASRGYTGALVRSLAVSPNRGSTLYAGNRSGVYRTEDGGEHWVGTQYPPPELLRPGAPVKLTEITSVVIDPLDPAHIIASSIEAGLLVSDDGGRSWRLPLLPTGAHEPVSLALAPTDPAIVYAASAKFRCQDESGVNPIECTTSASGVLISEDGGESWGRAGSALDGKGVLTVEVHPHDPDIVFAGTHSLGIYQSQDRGATWTPVGAGLPPVPVLDLAIHPVVSSLMFAGLQGGAVYRSVDGGLAFSPSSAGLPPNAEVYSVVVDPTDPGVVYAADVTSGAYVSVDSGGSWQAINTGLEHLAVRALSLSPDGSVLYAGVKGAGVWRLGTPPAEPVANDTCEGAIEIGTGTYSEQFSDAGSDGGASCAAPGEDLWYRHVATESGILRISTCGTHDLGIVDAGLDTVVSVHAGCPGAPANELEGGCSDNWGTGSDPAACALTDTDQAADGAVAVAVQAGQEVWIRVGRQQSAEQGEFWLTVASGADTPVPATSLLGLLCLGAATAYLGARALRSRSGPRVRTNQDPGRPDIGRRAVSALARGRQERIDET